MPRWASRWGVLVTAWLALVTGAALWIPHDWDWRVFARLASLANPAFSTYVRIADLGSNADIPATRRRIAALLDTLVASDQRPNAVILDTEFEGCRGACGEPRERARVTLAASIRAAVRRFPVFAVQQPALDEKGAMEYDPLIYGAVSGTGHTTFTPVPSSGSVFYQACYPHVRLAGSGAGIFYNVWSIVDRAIPAAPAGAPEPCEPAFVPVYLGPALDPHAPAIHPISDTASMRRLPRLDGAYLVVGTVAFDRPQDVDRSGPELLGWALSNALDRLHRNSVGTRPQNGMLLAIVPAFSALAAVCFGAIFGALRRARLRRLRSALPWLSALASAALGLAAFTAFEAWMLYSREIQPQVTLVGFAVLLTAGLCGLRGYQTIVEEQSAVDVRPSDQYDYDVFISYAHEEGAWVYEHVYLPFRDATLSDGRKLSVFFDSTTIRGGTAWQEAIALSIDASRFIVPVYSATYFAKPYCRFEIRRAHRKWIGAGEDSRCVLPVMRGHPTIDAAVDDIQATSIDDRPSIVDDYVREVVQRLSPVRD